MKKTLLVICMAALVLGSFSIVVEAAKGGNRGDNQVAICHFGGHGGDFVTTGKGCGCLRRGGNVIIVGQKACLNGHGAAGDCTADNIGDLNLGACD